MALWKSACKNDQRQEEGRQEGHTCSARPQNVSEYLQLLGVPGQGFARAPVTLAMVWMFRRAKGSGETGLQVRAYVWGREGRTQTEKDRARAGAFVKDRQTDSGSRSERERHEAAGARLSPAPGWSELTGMWATSTVRIELPSQSEALNTKRI